MDRPHSPYFRWTGPGQLTAKEAASRPRTPAGRFVAAVKALFLGRPLASEAEIGERRDEHVAGSPRVLTDEDLPARSGHARGHGPGQVVAYPLLDLRRLGIFVKELVFRIEQATIQTLDRFGVDARRVQGAPGVYVPFPGSRAEGIFAGLAKIGALGIKVSNGRSYHGVALNVGMDLAPFSLINPCGYANLPAVDLKTLDIHVEWTDAAVGLAERLQTHLS